MRGKGALVVTHATMDKLRRQNEALHTREEEITQEHIHDNDFEKE